LKKLNIDNLIIIGTSTHICVDSTVRDAYQNGYNVIVIRDLVATREEEKRFHNSTLELIEKQFGRVIHSEEILKLIIAKTKTQGDAVLSSLRSSPFHNNG
ncbi:MAG: isochorismatase family protein, partial [Patescibacteria group bacterium]|nr:isochorismatase family protein [Patescibacteria group bacterium]